MVKKASAFCQRVNRDVEITINENGVAVDCWYFKLIPKGPACKKVIFGPLGFPIPTPRSMVGTVAKIISLGFWDVISIYLGIRQQATPSWLCQPAVDFYLKHSKEMEDL